MCISTYKNLYSKNGMVINFAMMHFMCNVLVIKIANIIPKEYDGAYGLKKSFNERANK